MSSLYKDANPLEGSVTDSFNIAIPTLDSREAPYSSPLCEEKQHSEVEGGQNIQRAGRRTRRVRIAEQRYIYLTTQNNIFCVHGTMRG